MTPLFRPFPICINSFRSIRFKLCHIPFESIIISSVGAHSVFVQRKYTGPLAALSSVVCRQSFVYIISHGDYSEFCSVLCMDGGASASIAVLNTGPGRKDGLITIQLS